MHQQIATAAGNKSTKQLAKADRGLFRRLLVASNSGRTVDLTTLLTHELSPVPLSIATIDGKLLTSDKAS